MMNKTVAEYMELPYTIELTRDAEDGWFVRVKELPGCMSQGDTAEEALAMIEEAMSLWLEAALEQGLSIPEPRPAEGYSGKFVLRLPRSLHRKLAERAEDDGVSLNQFVVSALAQAVGRGQAASRPVEAARVEAEQPAASWPGVKPAVRSVLLAAGYQEEAGALDEILFCRWFEQALAQVESASRRGYARESGLPYLEHLQKVIAGNAGASPMLQMLQRTVDFMLHNYQERLRLQERYISGPSWEERLDLERREAQPDIEDLLRQLREFAQRPPITGEGRREPRQ